MQSAITNHAYDQNFSYLVILFNKNEEEVVLKSQQRYECNVSC